MKIYEINEHLFIYQNTVSYSLGSEQKLKVNITHDDSTKIQVVFRRAWGESNNGLLIRRLNNN